MTLSRYKRIAASQAELVKAMQILVQRQQSIEAAHNGIVDALNSLADRFGLEWDEVEKCWMKKEILVPFEGISDRG